MPKVAIIGTRYRDFSVEEEILRHLDAEIVAGPGGDPDEIVSLAGDADVILAGSAPRFTAEVLDRLDSAGIVRYGVGTESVDLEAASRNGIWVARVAEYGTDAVALHSLTLGLAAVRRLPEADRSLRAGTWNFADLRPLQLPSALTVGVLGYGRIGRATAKLFAATGFKVLAFDPLGPALDPGVESASFDEILSGADLISLHLPGNPDGSPVIGTEQIGSLKSDSVIVNTARGSLIDLDALAAGLAENRPRIAALDVFPKEPVDLAPLEAVIDRVILSPHMAWYTEQSELALRQGAAERAASLIRGERPDDVVAEPNGAGA